MTFGVNKPLNYSPTNPPKKSAPAQNENKGKSWREYNFSIFDQKQTKRPSKVNDAPAILNKDGSSTPLPRNTNNVHHRP